MGLEPQRCGQHGELLGNEGTKRPERGLAVEPGTHRPHLGDAPGELLGEQPHDDAKDVMDQTHPALHPAHRTRELDRIAAQRIARRGRRATQGFLDLFRAYFNLRTRRWGRHKGTSAHQSLTGQPVHDWLTWLGYPPSPALA